MGDLVDEFEDWRSNGQKMTEKLMARREAVLVEIGKCQIELDRLNQALMKLGTKATLAKRNRSKGQGTVTANRSGWRWRVCREGKTYVGKTVPDRQVAEASLNAALAALDRGEDPVTSVVTPDQANPARLATPAAPAKKPRRPSAPDPERIRMIAASAERSGGPMPTDPAGDLQAITRGIAKLPARLANIARRHWLRGQKPELIAREMQVTVQAVEEMLVEARQLAIAADAA